MKVYFSIIDYVDTILYHKCSFLSVFYDKIRQTTHICTETGITYLHTHVHVLKRTHSKRL